MKLSRPKGMAMGGGRGEAEAALFVYVAEGLENMAFISNAVSLVAYFHGFMNFNIAKSANTLTNFMGTSFMLALFGGFMADTYFSRLNTCILFGSIELLGYALMTVQAHVPGLRPFPCKDMIPSSMNQCQPASSGQTALLFSGLYLIALGTSGVKAALPALGADQFDKWDTKEAALLSGFFNWFMLSLNIGATTGVTLVVWISDRHGCDLGFGVCTMAVFTAIFVLWTGKSFYRKNAPKGSPVLRILRVCVAAIRNRNLPVPDISEKLYEVDEKEVGMGTEMLQRTDQFRFLDRAAVVTTSFSGSSSNLPRPWHICTVTQVEETKILFRMVPIIISTAFINTCLAQVQTFSIHQSMTMDTRLFGFKVPTPSLPVIPIVFICILIPVYDRIFIPLARKITGIPTGIRSLQRIGTGLVLSAISMAVGLVETRRKLVSTRYNMVDSKEPLPMSVFWLSIQYIIIGAADAFTVVGILQFFYEESSSGMKSMGTAISWFSTAIGFFLSSVAVEVVNKASGGWLANDNLNRNKLNYFYWILSGMSVLNIGLYSVCASWYRYKKVEVKQEGNNGINNNNNTDAVG